MSTDMKEFQYSSGFIDKIKQELPNTKDPPWALDSGSHPVGSLFSAEAQRPILSASP